MNKSSESVIVFTNDVYLRKWIKLVRKWLENGSNDLLSAVNLVNDIIFHSSNDLSCKFEWYKFLKLLPVNLLNLRLKIEEHAQFFWVCLWINYFPLADSSHTLNWLRDLEWLYKVHKLWFWDQEIELGCFCLSLNHYQCWYSY